MAQKYDHGLGASEDAAQTYAWVQWARLHGSYDVDDNQLEEWESYVAAITSEADIEHSKKLLNEMRGRADEMI
jgi:hypothetical protein